MDTVYGFEDIAGELRAVEFYAGHEENRFGSYYPRIFADMQASHPVDLQDAEFLRLLIMHSLFDGKPKNGSKELIENFASVASSRLLETDILVMSGFRI